MRSYLSAPLNLLLTVAFIWNYCSVAIAQPPEPFSTGLSATHIESLAEQVHEALERENPDLKGARSIFVRLFHNWNYFRTYVNQMRLRHSLGEDNSEATRVALDTSVLLLGTHLGEHVVGHGTHYLSTFSQNPWVYWGGTIAGEALASPFVEVFCLGGICLYSRSEQFRNTVTRVRVGTYENLLAGWLPKLAHQLGLPLLASHFLETTTGQERLERSLINASKTGIRQIANTNDGALHYSIVNQSEEPLLSLSLDALANGDIALKALRAYPRFYSASDWKVLKKSLRVLGWNISDAVLSTLAHIKEGHWKMLESEVFYRSWKSEGNQEYSVEFKPGSVRRFRRWGVRTPPCLARLLRR
jgi:hypothetical protein